MTAAVPITSSPANTSTVRVPVADIVPSKTNPRTSFSAEDTAELAASIRKHGIFQPLILRDHPSKADAWELIDGERRLRAAKEAGLDDVPAVIGSYTDEQVLEMQIVSFLQRKDLTAMEEAQCFNSMLVKDYTLEKIAGKVGRSVEYVRGRCRLLKLVKGAAELLAAGRIEVGHALLLAGLSPEDQIRTIREPQSGGYASDRHSGLWQMQRDFPGTSMGPGDDDDGVDALKAVSVSELKAWIQDHVRLEPRAPQTAELFPEVAAAVAEASVKTPGEKPLKVVEITTSSMLNDDTRDPKRRVLSRASWARADGRAGSKTCANSVIGIVVAGDGQGEAFRICIDKKHCQVHYKAEIAERAAREKAVAKSGKTGEARAALEKTTREAAEKKRKEDHERFLRALPAIQVAFAEWFKIAPLAKVQNLILEARRVQAGLALARKLMPGDKGAESWIRSLGLAEVLEETTSEWVRESDLIHEGKPMGIDVIKIIASANENDAATKEARKKPSKAKAKAPAKAKK